MIRVVYLAGVADPGAPVARQLERIGLVPLTTAVESRDGRTELIARSDALFAYGDWFGNEAVRVEVGLALHLGKPILETIDEVREWMTGGIREHPGRISQQVPSGGRPGQKPSRRDD